MGHAVLQGMRQQGTERVQDAASLLKRLQKQSYEAVSQFIIAVYPCTLIVVWAAQRLG